MASYIKIEERKAKRQPWKLNTFRGQEEGEEEPVPAETDSDQNG